MLRMCGLIIFRSEDGGRAGRYQPTNLGIFLKLAKYMASYFRRTKNTYAGLDFFAFAILFFTILFRNFADNLYTHE